MNPTELEACMNDPELAMKNLGSLLELVNHEDETTSNYAVESLENCGAPTAEHLGLLQKCLSDSDSLRVYWDATLLGRLFAEQAEELAGSLPPLQVALGQRLNDKSLDDSARERICWAITKLPSIDEGLRTALQAASQDAKPRMLKLIETALSI
ncbi:hypothetical protein SH449x_005052 [Pirellulaceae bacterium SH449]